MSAAPFASDEVERYARHLVLAGVGGPGQQRLKSARVLVIGAGGLGSPVIAYLAAAGIGRLRVADDDTVSLSNLQRQVIHGTGDVGRPKTESAGDAVTRLNPHVAFEAVAERFSKENAARLLRDVDVVADGSDNADTRYLVAEACDVARVPLVSAAVHGFDGHVTTLKPFARGPDGRLRPTLKCLYPEPPEDGAVDECARTGILGVVTGVIGTLQANEVIKVVLEVGEPLVARCGLALDVIPTPELELLWRLPRDSSEAAIG
ncbi:MAG: HesA/MoeB/ThiF family protein, partial [Pseudomonadota bacterium]